MFKRSLRRVVWLGGSAQITALGTDARPASGQFVNVIPEGNQSRRNAKHFNPTPLNQHLMHEYAQPEIRQVLSRLPETWPIPSRYSIQLRADVYDELLKLPLRYALHDFRKLEAHLFAYKSAFTAENHSYTQEANNINHNTEKDEIVSHPGFYRFRKPLSSNANKRADCSNDDDVVDVNNNDNNGNNKTIKETDSSILNDVYGVAGRVSGVGYAPPLGPADPLDTIAFFVHRNSNGNFHMKVRSINLKNLTPIFYLQIGSIDGDIFRFEEELMKMFPTKKIFVRSEFVYVYNVNYDGLMVVRHWLLGLGF